MNGADVVPRRRANFSGDHWFTPLRQLAGSCTQRFEFGANIYNILIDLLSG
jgi:hypothetical protein